MYLARDKKQAVFGGIAFRLLILFSIAFGKLEESFICHYLSFNLGAAHMLKEV